MGKTAPSEDFLDRLIVFLAKRDGIDKLVKTFQYVSRLAHWRLEKTNPELAKQTLFFAGQCGLARKAFRLGRFLSGLNALRKSKQPSHLLTILNVIGHSGDMVYFFFDHLCWLSKGGILNPKLAEKFSHISASGEIFLYLAFIVVDIIFIREENLKKKQLEVQLSHQWRLREGVSSQIGKEKHSRFSPFAPSPKIEKLQENLKHRFTIGSQSSDEERKEISLKSQNFEEKLKPFDQEIEKINRKLRDAEWRKILRLLGIAANVADTIIAVAEVQPNPLCNHPAVFAASGLVSAWSGWAKNWPFPE